MLWPSFECELYRLCNQYFRCDMSESILTERQHSELNRVGEKEAHRLNKHHSCSVFPLLEMREYNKISECCNK